MGRRRRRVKRHKQVKQKVIVLSHSVPCDCWLLAALPPPGDDDDDDDEPTAFICIFLKCCLRDWPCYSWGLNADSPQINSRLRSFLFPLRKYSQIHDARLDLFFSSLVRCARGFFLSWRPASWPYRGQCYYSVIGIFDTQKFKLRMTTTTVTVPRLSLVRCFGLNDL